MTVRPLSSFLSESLISNLRVRISSGLFPTLSFESAMKFILSDGVIPESGRNLEDFLRLEDWLRESQEFVSYSATDLKNKTGQIIDAALSGKTVHIVRHKRVILEIKGTHRQ